MKEPTKEQLFDLGFTEDQLVRLDKLLKGGRHTWPTLGVHNRNDLIRYLVESALKKIEEAAPMFGYPRKIGPLTK